MEKQIEINSDLFKDHLILVAGGFLFTPILFVTSVFIPMLGQILGLLNIGVTLFYFYLRGFRYLPSALLGCALFIGLVFIYGRAQPMVFQLIGGVGLMFGLPLSIAYLVTIGCLTYKRMPDNGR